MANILIAKIDVDKHSKVFIEGAKQGALLNKLYKDNYQIRKKMFDLYESKVISDEVYDKAQKLDYLGGLNFANIKNFTKVEIIDKSISK